VKSLLTEPGRNNLRIDRNALLAVGVAVTLLEQNLAVLDDHNDRASDITILECIGQQTIRPRLQVCSLQPWRPGTRS
jgi:hypothetical protein